MKIIIFFLLFISFANSSIDRTAIFPNLKVHLSQQGCDELLKSVIDSNIKIKESYKNKNFPKYIKFISFQKEKITVFNSNKCYLYFDNSLEMKTVGEKTIVYLQSVIDQSSNNN